MKTSQPKTIQEAINNIETFFMVDMWTKFYPIIKIKGTKGKWCREDYFKSKKDLDNYLRENFDILRKEIKRIRRKK